MSGFDTLLRALMVLLRVLLPWRSVSMTGVAETAPSDTVGEAIRLNYYETPTQRLLESH